MQSLEGEGPSYATINMEDGAWHHIQTQDMAVAPAQWRGLQCEGTQLKRIELRYHVRCGKGGTFLRGHNACGTLFPDHQDISTTTGPPSVAQNRSCIMHSGFCHLCCSQRWRNLHHSTWNVVPLKQLCMPSLQQGGAQDLRLLWTSEGSYSWAWCSQMQSNAVLQGWNFIHT